MITWMQRHKKWLVITIWISTIAFIGAGFVGWGSYDYGKKSGVVAVVGDREISLDEYQREYSNLYEQYARMLGGQFNQEMAKQFNLSDAAYNLVIQKNLILSYADELGLDVTDEDIAKEVVKYKAFQKDGKFDKDTYVQVLAQNRTNPVEFENSLKRNLLLNKIESILNVQANEKEIEDIGKLLFIEDNINITVLDANEIKIDVKEDALKQYWETNKNNYMSDTAYELETKVIPLIKQDISDEEVATYYSKFKTDFTHEDGKIKTLEEAKADIINAILVKETKKEALKTYLDLKKAKAQFDATSMVYENELLYPLENIKEIQTTPAGEVLKPFLYNNEYIVVKVNSKNDPQPLSYNEAKPAAKEAYIAQERQIQIAQKAKAMLENFKGSNVGYVNRTSVNKLPGLSQNEAADFLNQLFNANSVKGSITLNNKIVLYKINKSRLNEIDKSKKEVVESTLSNLQNSELMSNLISNLENRYEIQSSVNDESKDK